jgi:LuxR family quorum-sensing system transcriptional regulator SolR
MLHRECQDLVSSIRNTIHLTQRQSQCLDCLLGGKSAKQIARILQISPRTVETHIAKIMMKFGCHSRLEVISKLKGLY